MIHRALTVRQPWASCFFLPVGPKDVENRSKPPPKGMVGQRLWIHAGLTLQRDAIDECVEFGLDLPPGNPCDGRWIRGAIIGSVLLVDCVELHTSRWRITERDGRRYRFAWVVSDARLLAKPVPCKGSISLGWRVPDEIVAKLEAISA